MLAYHFVADKLRDGRNIPADGEWLIHEGELIPCQSGLHASEHPFDALRYAPENTLCLVELDGEIISHNDDKVVARRRRIVKRVDATNMLRRFAADQALSVAHLWNMPEIVREYLQTLDENKRIAAASAAAYAAAYAAYAAAYAAAYTAASAAAYAAYTAAYAAVYAAAYTAAYTAYTAAYAAAYTAAYTAAKTEFLRRVEELFKE